MKKRKQIRSMIFKIIIILIVLGVAVYGITLGYLCIQEGKIPKNAADLTKDYDAVIVLGAQVKPDGIPSVQLSWRLDRAAEVWEQKNVPVESAEHKGKMNRSLKLIL